MDENELRRNGLGVKDRGDKRKKNFHEFKEGFEDCRKKGGEK
jgi:hypothetical protein